MVFKECGHVKRDPHAGAFKWLEMEGLIAAEKISYDQLINSTSSRFTTDRSLVLVGIIKDLCFL